jgi:hypothetical protein
MKMHWSSFKYKTRKAERKDHEDFAAFVIHHRSNGAEVHRECVPTGRMNNQRVTDLLIRGRERLEKKFPPAGYEIESGLFNSEASFQHFFPQSA